MTLHPTAIAALSRSDTTAARPFTATKFPFALQLALLRYLLVSQGSKFQAARPHRKYLPEA